VLGQQKEVNIRVKNKMAKRNTEKPAKKIEQKKQEIVKTSKKSQLNDGLLKAAKNNEVKKEVLDEIKQDAPINKPSQLSDNEQIKDKSDESTPAEKKQPIQKKPVVKKTEAIVRGISVPISTKHSIAVCRFIKNKKIETAIKDLEDVLMYKKAVPMKGEIPHRKGKGIMSGRYPKKAVESFIKLLKSLLANSNANELENPVIKEAFANLAQRPAGRFGRTKKKRTHINIKVIEKKIVNKNKSKDKKK